jgi:hypothetical protein
VCEVSVDCCLCNLDRGRVRRVLRRDVTEDDLRRARVRLDLRDLDRITRTRSQRRQYHQTKEWTHFGARYEIASDRGKKISDRVG